MRACMSQCQQTAMPIQCACLQDLAGAGTALAAGLESSAGDRKGVRLRDEHALMHGVLSSGLAANGSLRHESGRASADCVGDRLGAGSIASGIVQSFRGSRHSSGR